jgi:hypothetical protein
LRETLFSWGLSRMPRVHVVIQGVFGHFQNLNLLVLLDDLRRKRVTHNAWAAGKLLCPIAHGMPFGQLVSDLRYLGQTAKLERACDYAARQLGANPANVHRFVELWDSHTFSTDWLLAQLERIWSERQADADAVQEVINGAAPATISTFAGR